MNLDIVRIWSLGTRHPTWRRVLRSLALSCALLVLATGCESWFLEEPFDRGDYFYLENEDAVMPVWVFGNLKSRTFVVFLHGGPGNTSMTYAKSDAYQRLAEDYAMVFWDQRASGISQGNAKPESLTVEQFVEDTRKLIQLVRHRYAVDSLFLLGKSWGGCVGTAYLIEEQQRGDVTAWVEVDGAHNLEEGIPLSWDWVVNAAQREIDAGHRVGHWEKEIRWYQSEPSPIDTDYFVRHGANLNDLHGIYRNPANDPGNALPLASPVSPVYLLNAYYLNFDNRLDLRHINLTSQMDAMTLPALILWGRHDGTLPVSLAQDAYDHLGTPEADKEVFIFEQSGHVPSAEETDLFVSTLKGFIEKYR